MNDALRAWLDDKTYLMNILQHMGVDVAEVARCKDCIYCENGGRLNMCMGLPLKTGYSFEMSVNDDDYCSFGKRKDNE
jgi:hypothetical protein